MPFTEKSQAVLLYKLFSKNNANLIFKITCVILPSNGGGIMADGSKNSSDKKFILLIVSLIVVSILLFLFFQRSISKQPGNIAYVTEIKDMLVNTKDDKLHVKMSVDIESENKEQSEKLSEKSSEIRDKIMEIVEELDSDTATQPNITDAIKKKIKSYLDENYPGSKIVGVYFSDYITQ